MTAILPGSSLAAIGRQSPLLRLPPSSCCSVYLTLQHQQSRHSATQQQYRYASKKLRPPRAAPAASLARSQGLKPPQNASPPPQTTSSAILSPSSPASSAAAYDFSDKITPPSTTLPAPLSLPERHPDQGTVSYYLKVGKAYWSFYKTGIRNVWRNAQERRRLVRRRRISSRKQAPPSMADTKHNAVLDERALGQYANYPFTRAEFQFFTRSWRDAKRIPIFIILLGLFGEYLPLIVVVCTPLVPYTCRIPKQIRKGREKLEERRSKSFRGDMGGVPTPLKKGTEQEVRDVKDLDALQLRHISRSLGLYFRFWERLGTVWPPAWVLRRRLRKRLQYLEIDDALFRRDGGVALLKGDEEIRIAAEDRGIDVLNRSTGDMHRILRSWERGSEQGRTLVMLLSRPSIWAPDSSR